MFCLDLRIIKRLQARQQQWLLFFYFFCQSSSTHTCRKLYIFSLVIYLRHLFNLNTFIFLMNVNMCLCKLQWLWVSVDLILLFYRWLFTQPCITASHGIKQEGWTVFFNAVQAWIPSPRSPFLSLNAFVLMFETKAEEVHKISLCKEDNIVLGLLAFQILDEPFWNGEGKCKGLRRGQTNSLMWTRNNLKQWLGSLDTNASYKGGEE